MPDNAPSNRWNADVPPPSKPKDPTRLWNADAPPQPIPPPPKPVIWRELLTVAAAVALADATIYHGAGFAGIAALFTGLTLLLWFGAAKPRFNVTAVTFAVLLLIVSAKLVWCGFLSTAAAGVAAILIFGTIQSGTKFRIPEICAYSFESLFSGGSRLNDYGRFIFSHRAMPSGIKCLAVFLPLCALLVFGTLFVLANPALVTMVREFFERIGDFLNQITSYLPDVLQIPFWVLCAWLAAGLLNPMRLLNDNNESSDAPSADLAAERSQYYAACRNTLFTVIILFAVYLVFEFKTLWFQEFSEGFCYSGYSHEGAVWLTVALALSTVILSLIFQTEMLRDPRIGTLRTLAWTWSFLNIILALAVYNRLYIYIGFNGMTRMRVVGLLGMTAVLIGFIFVVRKIAKGKSFRWLLSRFTWTVLAMVFLYCVLPVDYLVHRYNVARILRGDLTPSVQITVHPCANEGYLTFLPLMNCENEIIREGIRAHLANKLFEMRRDQVLRTFPHIDDPLRFMPKREYAWTRYQAADVLLLRQLEANRDVLAYYLDNRTAADIAFRRFADYAYRWY